MLVYFSYHFIYYKLSIIILFQKYKIEFFAYFFLYRLLYLFFSLQLALILLLILKIFTITHPIVLFHPILLLAVVYIGSHEMLYKYSFSAKKDLL
jgi:hypothetical protein